MTAIPRRAATVVVLRANQDVPEVLLVKRARTLAFMADAFVFPGGRAEDSERTRPARVGGSTFLRHAPPLPEDGAVGPVFGEKSGPDALKSAARRPFR